MNIVNHLTITCLRNLGTSHDHTSHRCTGQSPYWTRLGGRALGGLHNVNNAIVSLGKDRVSTVLHETSRFGLFGDMITLGLGIILF